MQTATAKQKSAARIDWGRVREVLVLIYAGMASLVGFLAFIVTYIAMTVQYGLLFGGALGWFPAGLIGFLAGVFWPLAVGAVLLSLAMIQGKTALLIDEMPGTRPEMVRAEVIDDPRYPDTGAAEILELS